MVKKLLSAIALATVALTVSAQVWVGSDGQTTVRNGNKTVAVQKKFKSHLAQQPAWQKNGPLQVMPKARKSPLQVPLAPEADNSIWWGYPLGQQMWGWGFAALDEALGAGGMLASQTNYNVAMYVPNNYAGGRIDSLAIMFLDPAKMSDVKIWFGPLSTDNDGYPVLPEKAEDALYWFDLPTSKIEAPEQTPDGYNIKPTLIEVPEPFNIPVDGVCIGYSFKGESTDMPIIVGDESHSGGFFFSYLYNSIFCWDDFGGMGAGNLTTQAMINLDNCIKNKAQVGYIGEYTVKADAEALVSSKISNVGPNEINSVSYVLTVDGVAGAETAVTFSQPLPSQKATYLDVPATFQEGNHEIVLKVTKVNGEPNALEGVGEVEKDGYVVAIANPAERISVVEETTGTWCQWCPRGHVGMEKLDKTLGDKVIGIATHISAGQNAPDPMECSSYMDFHRYLSGGSAPSALFDRVVMADPYSGLYELTSADDHYRFAADKVVETIQSEIPSEAKVLLDANWTDDTKTAIKANVTTTFAINRDDAPYGIIFVLKEDGMSGTDMSWYQVNAYRNPGHGFTDSDMDKFNNGKSYVNMSYDDVAVAAWDIIEGRAGSIQAPIVKDAAQEFSMALSIARNTLIQNKDNLTLVAMLVNRNNLRIVNAAKVDMIVYSGIDGVEAGGGQLDEVARYNANGVRIDAPAKGVNIVKMSDGSVRKVVVE